MKIAIISLMNGSLWGGSEELWQKTAGELLQQGHDVLVSVYNWGKIHPKVKDLQEQGTKVHFWGKRQRKKSQVVEMAKFRYRKHFGDSTGFFKQMLEYEPDVVLINQGSTYDFLGKADFLKFLDNLRADYFLLCHLNNEHDVLSIQDRALARKVFIEAKKVIFVSERNKNIAARQMAINLDQAIIIREILSLDDISCIPYIQGLPQFACVGRLDCRHKGQDVLLDVLKEQKWKSRNWQLTFYGAGEDQHYLEELIACYQLQDRVRFGGYQEMREIFKKTHLFVMPSLKEGTPISLMEAMACGLPAVVTDVGGNAEVIQEGFSGFVAEAPSVKYLDAAMEKAWQAKDQWHAMGKNARHWLLENIDLMPHHTLAKILST